MNSRPTRRGIVGIIESVVTETLLVLDPIAHVASKRTDDESGAKLVARNGRHGKKDRFIEGERGGYGDWACGPSLGRIAG